jgi:hypothetical protein
MPVLPIPEKACFVRHVCCSWIEHGFQNNIATRNLLLPQIFWKSFYSFVF